MAILTQLLIIAAVLATLYASFIHNREKYDEIIGILPDFKKLIRKDESAFVKVVVFVPDSHADAVREAIGAAGGGTVGNYTSCSFSSQGIGRFKPEHGAHPVVGTIGKLELVAEERIEFISSRENIQKVIAAIKKAHPYEETVIDIYPLEALPTEATIHS